jgi:hypothetical protein
VLCMHERREDRAAFYRASYDGLRHSSCCGIEACGSCQYLCDQVSPASGAAAFGMSHQWLFVCQNVTRQTVEQCERRVWRLVHVGAATTRCSLCGYLIFCVCLASCPQQQLGRVCWWRCRGCLQRCCAPGLAIFIHM